MHANDQRILTSIAAASGLLSAPIISALFNTSLFNSVFFACITATLLIILEHAAFRVIRLLGAQRPYLFKLFRFSATGVFNTALDTSILTSFALVFSTYSGIVLALFNSLSFTLTTIASYYINRNWSFASDHTANVREFGGFFGVAIASTLLNSGMVYFLTTHITAPLGMNAPQWIVVVKVLGVVFSFVWNFAWYQWVIFKKPVLLTNAPNRYDAETKR